MGFLSKIISATVKTVLTPIAIVKDAVNIATGEEADATKDLLESAADDVMESGDDLGDGNFL
jgi:hypothetical protein